MNTIPWTLFALALGLPGWPGAGCGSCTLAEAAFSPAIRQEVAQQPWSLSRSGASAPAPEEVRFTAGAFLKEHAWHILTVVTAQTADRLYQSGLPTTDEPDAAADPIEEIPLLPGETPDTSHGFLVDHKSPILRGLAVGAMVAVNRASLRGYADDVMGMIEAHKFNWATSGLVKNLVRRPRPHSTERDSFYSDAASTAFTWMAYTDSVLARGFEGRPAARALTAAGLYGVAGYIAWSRVDAGRHYTSDVLAGAAAGFAVGKLFYRANHHAGGGTDAEPRIQVTPAVTPDGGSVMIAIRF